MKVKPLADRVIVKLEKNEAKTAGLVLNTEGTRLDGKRFNI